MDPFNDPELGKYRKVNESDDSDVDGDEDEMEGQVFQWNQSHCITQSKEVTTIRIRDYKDCLICPYLNKQCMYGRIVWFSGVPCKKLSMDVQGLSTVFIRGLVTK